MRPELYCTFDVAFAFHFLALAGQRGCIAPSPSGALNASTSAAFSVLSLCLSLIQSRMPTNFLRLNADKAAMFLLSPKCLLDSLSLSAIFHQGNYIVCASGTRKLLFHGLPNVFLSDPSHISRIFFPLTGCSYSRLD